MHRSLVLLVAASVGLAGAGCNFGTSTQAAGTDGGFSTDAGQLGLDGSTSSGSDATAHDAAPDADAAPGKDAAPEGEAGPAPTAKLGIATATGSSTADFGTVQVGQSSAPLTITVSNGGTASTTTLTASLGGTNASSFVVDSDGCTGKTLAASTTCTVRLHFAPAASGALSASLTVDAAGDGQVSAALTGQGVTPGALSLAPGSQDFGSVSTGATSAAKPFTVTNTGMSATATLAMAVTGSSAAAFVISQDTCTGTALAAGATCTLAVTFGPATAGALDASLGATAGSNTATSSLSGTGLGPAVFSVSPATFAFASTIQGTGSAVKTFTVTNTGGDPSGVPQVAVSGPNASDFIPSANTCTVALTSGATCTFGVAFSPSTATAESATVTVTGTASTAGTAALTGTGLTPPTLVIAPATGFTGDFGVVGLGKNATGNMTLTNTGQAAMTVAPSLGSANPDFTVTAGTPACNAPLAVGGSCGFVVTFAPTTAPPAAESSVLTATAAGATSGVYTVKGTGAQPTLAISPPAAWPGFGSVEVDSTATADFTVTNTGLVATSAAPTITSANPDFTVSTGTVPCTGMLAASTGKCDFIVTFAPKAKVTTDSSLLTASVTPGTAGTYTVSGSGVVPTLAITPATGFSFGYVTVGQPVSQSFQVQNMGPGTSSAPSFGSNNGDFTVTQGATLPCTTTLTSGQTCNFDIVFKPSSSAALETAVITATPQLGNAGTTTVTGQGGVGVLAGLTSWTATATDQGSVTGQAFTIVNNGEGTTNALTVTAPAAASPFSLTNDSCTGAVLVPTQSCSVTVRFAPTTSNSTPATTAGASMSVTDSATDTQSASLAGLVLSPTAYVVFSPSPGNFGNNLTLNQTYSVTFTGTNYSSQQAVIGGVEAFGGGGSDYVFSQGAGSTCSGATLGGYGNAGNTCTYVLNVVPKSDNAGFGAAASLTAESSANAPIGPGDPLVGTW